MNASAKKWYPFGNYSRGKVDMRLLENGCQALAIEAITGTGGWESEAFQVQSADQYLLSWQIKDIGAGGFSFPAPRSELENRVYENLQPTSRPFDWHAILDFAGIEIIFLDENGHEVDRLTKAIHVEVCSGLVGTAVWDAHLAVREDMSKNWSSVWLRFAVPRTAISLSVRFLIKSRAWHNGGIAIKTVKLRKELADTPPEKGKFLLTLRTIDLKTQVLRPTRIWIHDDQGNSYKPEYCIDGVFPAPYFYNLTGETSVELLVGKYFIQAMCGFEYRIAHASVSHAREGEHEKIQLEMIRPVNMRAANWLAEDHHLHLSGHALKDLPMVDHLVGLQMADADCMGYIPYQADFKTNQLSAGQEFSTDNVIGQPDYGLSPALAWQPVLAFMQEPSPARSLFT